MLSSELACLPFKKIVLGLVLALPVYLWPDQKEQFEIYVNSESVYDKMDISRVRQVL